MEMLCSSMVSPRKTGVNLGDLSISYGDAYNKSKDERKKRFSVSPDTEMSPSVETRDEDDASDDDEAKKNEILQLLDEEQERERITFV